MVHHMTDPSNNFHTGGALIDPQRIGCLPIISRWAVWFGILAMICGLYSCAQAQQMRIWGAEWHCADGSVVKDQNACPKAPNPPIKVCPEPPTTRTITDSKQLEAEIRARGGRLCE